MGFLEVQEVAGELEEQLIGKRPKITHLDRFGQLVAVDQKVQFSDIDFFLIWMGTNLDRTFRFLFCIF